jgi:hypothetical protein
LDVLLVVNFEDFAYVVESVWSIVSEGVNGRVIVLISEFSRDEFKVVFEVEVFGLLTNNLLETFDTSYCHLNTYHHVEN